MPMRAIVITGLMVSGLIATARRDAPAIKRIETANFSNLQAAVGTPYIAPGKSKEYFIYGPWMDYVDKVTFLGASQTIVEKKALWNGDGGLLRVKLSAPAGTSRGLRAMTVHTSCPPVPFTDCQERTITRNVMVLRVGALSQITPNSNLAKGQATSFTITGTGLDVAVVFPFRTMLSNTSDPVRTATTFQFTGTPMSCGTNVVLLRDEAEGGDFYPYTGGLSVATTATCAYQPPPVPSTFCATGTVYDPVTKTCVKPPEYDERPASRAPR